MLHDMIFCYTILITMMLINFVLKILSEIANLGLYQIHVSKFRRIDSTSDLPVTKSQYRYIFLNNVNLIFVFRDLNIFAIFVMSMVK